MGKASLRSSAEWVSLLGLLVGLLGIGVLYMPVWHGDAAIYLPYVRSLVERGQWMEFNPGELSSGATSPLWVLWVAPWWALWGVQGLKVAGSIAVIVAIVATFMRARQLGASLAEAFVPTLTVAYCTAPAGFLGYETPIAALGALVWTYLLPIETLDLRRVRMLPVLSAVTPLIRPEMSLLVAVYGAVAVLQRRWGLLLWLAAGGLVPVVYYGAMQALTGNFSASAYCRSFALREMAELSVLGMQFSRTFLLEFARSGLGFVAVLAAIGLACASSVRRDSEWWFAAGSFVGYFLFFTVIAPANSARYLAPIAFFLGWIAVWGIRQVRKREVFWGSIITVAGLLTLNVVGRAWDDRRRGYDFLLVTERECAEFLNTVAEPGAQVLAYEVQIRFWLRPDLRVLSLDGVTDGKVAPYLTTADMASFLWQQRPQYWVANAEGIERRPFLRRSLFAEVLGRNDAVVTVAGIRFERLRQWSAERLPRGFYGCTAVYRLRYGE